MHTFSYCSQITDLRNRVIAIGLGDPNHVEANFFKFGYPFG